MEEKYIELLLQKCTELETKNRLFIHYSVEIEPFIKKLVLKAKNRGLVEVYLDKYDPYATHDFLKKHTIQEIETSKYFDQSIWDMYVSKSACFLILETEYPGLMDDIDPAKIVACAKRKSDSKPLYKKAVTECQLSWCVAAYPGIRWANSLFLGEDSYQRLRQAIYHICMVDQEDPVASWNSYLNQTNQIVQHLNNLGLEKLVYSNSLGTSLELYLPKHYCFSSAQDRNVIVNMPSYEVFASPIYNKTKGVVYASKPLIYQGVLIDDFWLRFEKGKVVDFDAKVGKEVLKRIIETDQYSCYLGECALVEKTSPIARMNFTFGTTLIDENASCHLALGAGFPECIRGGFSLGERQLLEKGINISQTHVDFMIGTSDLSVIGITSEGNKISIFKDGCYDLEFLSHIGVK